MNRLVLPLALVCFAALNSPVDAQCFFRSTSPCCQPTCSPPIVYNCNPCCQPTIHVDSDLPVGLASKWYKLQIRTLPGPGGYGGTDGGVFVWIVGSRTRFPAPPRRLRYQLDSPGDSHEQNDHDIYYFRTDDLGTIRSEDIVEVASRSSLDHWSFKMKLYELDESSSKWVLVKDFADDHDFAANVNYCENGACTIYGSSVHIDANGQKLASRGTFPPGVDKFEISR